MRSALIGLESEHDGAQRPHETPRSIDDYSPLAASPALTGAAPEENDVAQSHR